MIVGFQGEPGAFSEEAAFALLGPVQTRGYRTFEVLVAAVDAGAVTYGLLPCENTITGPVARAYDVLVEHPRVAIVDETTHRIEQCLIGVVGATTEGLKRVASHPVALEQCQRFLEQHPNLSVDVADDTAGSIRAVGEAGDVACGAIGSALAAQRYNASVLKRGVQDDPDNLTRFFVISTGRTSRRNLGRACLALSLTHEPGSLHRALGVIAECGLNLRSLVARPNRMRPFEYVFYLELDAPSETNVDTLAASFCARTRMLGRY